MSRELRTHGVSLSDGPVVLRPLTELDWDLVLRMNSDPEVLYFSEGDAITARSLAEVQTIYRHVSQTAFCFVIERSGAAVGCCWLQQMNLERLTARYATLDCRRIDLELERAWWGKGIGKAALCLLTAFAFDEQGADAVFGCDVADYNARSRRLFESVGYVLDGRNPQPPGGKAKVTFDFVRRRTASASLAGR